MSCPKTPHLMQEYFSDELAPLAREELEKHLAGCAYCHTEFEALISARAGLQQWQDQQVPHWDRGLALFRQEHKSPASVSGSWNLWQWLPTGVSFAMLCVLFFNVSIVSSEQGFSISFGASQSSGLELQAQLAEFEQLQAEKVQALVVRMEGRADASNVQLMQALLEQTQQSTAQSFDQIYAYFEQQRLLDLQDMRAGYEQLVDSDYETIRSLQQLVSFVGYQEDVR